MSPTPENRFVRAQTKTASPSARAERPPAQYWRRWCEDAGPPLEVRDEADAKAEQLADASKAASSDNSAAPAAAASVRGQADAPASPFRVMIVEDDVSQALFAESVLMGAGMQATVVLATTDVMSTIEEFKPELVLMDLHMPGMDGAELTGLIRNHPSFSHVPIVFLTGDTDPERRVQVLEAGADDFLAKPVPPRHLIAAVQSRVKRARMLQRHRAGDGRHPSTGLYTRPHMLHRLNAAIPGQGEGGLFFLEIEGFAALRDEVGYVGVETLLTEAGRYVGELAGNAAVSRLNDNTFIIHVSGMEAAGLEDCARKFRDGVGRHVFEVEGQSLRLRTLVGYAALADGFDDASSALAAAEQALRHARTMPIGIARYTPPHARHDERDRAMAALVRKALAEDGFELAFQPVVAVAGGDQAQYQTLLRLRDADGELHTAAEILAAVEGSDQLHQIDQRVVQIAVDMLRERKKEQKRIRLFLTQSARTLASEGYADWLIETLSLAGIEPGTLVIDLRLDEALVHTLSLQEFCARMVPEGVQLCLSQYETGIDPESLLTRLPLGFIRLAARYSRELSDTATCDQMRQAIDQAHRHGLQVIGQQVEDPQAAATLWMSGVDYIQGNLVQRVAEGLDFDFQHSVL
ncbi:EAL domain-containing protein [Luteimonas vadosa]|uniref:EAL domain-containing response regulator n=1 Tax=Luteimonas vadosa TaxID=1165507 RepID=A0ABP9DXE1_9GAMM